MKRERTIILVKAWPQPSPKYGETVCCAGVTPEGAWRRLFPIRFRHLSGDAKFNRWDVVEYVPGLPKEDRRLESRRVDEPTLKKVSTLSVKHRAGHLSPLLRDSYQAAADKGESLTLIRPSSYSLGWKPKPASKLEAEKRARDQTLRQGSLWEKELAALEPCPFEIWMTFEDASGRHRMKCGDWETPATFFKWRRDYGEVGALERLRDRYEGEYRDKGVAFAMGTMAKYPKTWMLLGILRLDDEPQMSLF